MVILTKRTMPTVLRDFNRLKKSGFIWRTLSTAKRMSIVKKTSKLEALRTSK
jgi:hypothetical protein